MLIARLAGEPGAFVLNNQPVDSHKYAEHHYVTFSNLSSGLGPAHLVDVARPIAGCDMDLQFEPGLDLMLAGFDRSLKQKRH